MLHHLANRITILISFLIIFLRFLTIFSNEKQTGIDLILHFLHTRSVEFVLFVGLWKTRLQKCRVISQPLKHPISLV